MSKFNLSSYSTFINQIALHIRTPLYRNGYVLLLSAALTSCLGVLYWILAARYYSADIVGVNSAVISTMTLISGIAQLNLKSVMIRFIPRAGQATLRLILFSYAISIILSGLIGIIFFLVIIILFPLQKFLDTSWLFICGFIVSIMSWCVFMLQDNVLTGLRQTKWIPIENAIFLIIKIILLILFAGYFQKNGIFSSWMIPVFISLIPINYLIFRHIIPENINSINYKPIIIVPSHIAKYVAGDYVGSLFFTMYTYFLPIMVTQLSGASKNAYFYLPWTISSSLQLVAVNLTTSLTVEGAFDEDKLANYSRRTIIHIIRLLVPIVVVVMVSANYILFVFGRNYANEGANLLRLLTLSAFPNAIIQLYFSIARVRNRVRGIIITQGILCLLILPASYWSLLYYGITGIGLSWLLVQAAVAGVIFVFYLRPIMRLHGNN